MAAKMFVFAFLGNFTLHTYVCTLTFSGSNTVHCVHCTVFVPDPQSARKNQIRISGAKILNTRFAK